MYGILSAIVQNVCNPLGDDMAFRRTMALEPATRAEAFKTLRAEYPVRREFRRCRIPREGIPSGAADLLQELGFLLTRHPEITS